MREQWEKWGWVVALVIIAIGFLRIIWGREAFCEPNEHCLREWLSALGGWAAVAVAVPTIIFLSKQVSDAQRYHRENRRAQMQKSYALAGRTERVIERAEYLCAWIDQMLEETRPRFSIQDLGDKYDELLSVLNCPEFRMLEAEFAPPNSDDIQNLLGQLANGKRAIEDLQRSYTSDATISDIGDRGKVIGYNVHFAQTYLRDCTKIIQTVSAEYEALKL